MWLTREVTACGLAVHQTIKPSSNSTVKRTLNRREPSLNFGLFLVSLVLILSQTMSVHAETMLNQTVTSTAEAAPASQTLVPTVIPEMTTANVTEGNGTYPLGFGDLLQNRAMILRMTYVLLGVSAIVLCVFLVKAFRLRGQRSPTRKYGVLMAADDQVEIKPLGSHTLDSDDEEADTTVFEVGGSNIGGGRTYGGSQTSRLLP